MLPVAVYTVKEIQLINLRYQKFLSCQAQKSTSLNSFEFLSYYGTATLDLDLTPV